jgi:hypothetical protein
MRYVALIPRWVRELYCHTIFHKVLFDRWQDFLLQVCSIVPWAVEHRPFIASSVPLCTILYAYISPAPPTCRNHSLFSLPLQAINGSVTPYKKLNSFDFLWSLFLWDYRSVSARTCASEYVHACVHSYFQ